MSSNDLDKDNEEQKKEVKPKVHIGVIGTVDHSKRTLTYAIKLAQELQKEIEPEEELPFPIDPKSMTFVEYDEEMKLSKKKKNRNKN